MFVAKPIALELEEVRENAERPLLAFLNKGVVSLGSFYLVDFSVALPNDAYHVQLLGEVHVSCRCAPC